LQLRDTLEHVQLLQCPDEWELVVVNNGSSDGTTAVLDDWRRAFHGLLIVVDEPQRGVGRARNAGLRASHGDIVLFTDDDCYPAADLLLRAPEALNEPAIGFVGGRVVLHDPSDYPVALQTRTDRRELRPGAFIPAGFISGANMAFRRAALEGGGGFDDELGAGTPFACEDVDILARLLAGGWSGVYDPTLLVYHHHRRRTEAEAEALNRTYDVARGAYYAKCLLNPSLRAACARYWWRSLWRAPYGRSLREIAGGARYMAHRWRSTRKGPTWPES
jgi:glycosyltransferase involved in cell wall biosynthesis